MTLLLAFALFHSPARASRIDRCVQRLIQLKPKTAPRVPQLVQLRDGQIRHVSRLTARNLRATWQLSDAVFAQGLAPTAKRLGVSLLPTPIVPYVTKYVGGIELDALETHVMESDRGFPIATVALYAPARTLDLWVASLGVYNRARGDGLGRALLEWSIGQARDRGYMHLRAWSTDAPADAAINLLFRKADFVMHKLELCDPRNPAAQIVIWSRALQRREDPSGYIGNYAAVLYGLSRAQITKGVALYDQKRGC